MVGDTGGPFGGQEVCPRGAEEVERSVLLKRGRVGDIDHGLRADQDLGQTFACNRVDACIGRCGDRPMTHGLEPRNDLGSNQASAADDNDFHVCLRIAPGFAIEARSTFES
ncbi:hypothetical protein D3C87_1669270 [compost metagenome]